MKRHGAVFGRIRTFDYHFEKIGVVVCAEFISDFKRIDGVFDDAIVISERRVLYIVEFIQFARIVIEIVGQLRFLCDIIPGIDVVCRNGLYGRHAETLVIVCFEIVEIYFCVCIECFFIGAGLREEISVSKPHYIRIDFAGEVLRGRQVCQSAR